MHRLFGKSKAANAAPTPSLADASVSINNRVGALDEKIGGLDAELVKFKDQLRRVKGPTAEGIKRRALETLKRKKMYESQRDQMAGQAFNVEQTAFAIETVKDTQTTVFAMKAAAQALKVENQKIDIGACVVRHSYMGLEAIMFLTLFFQGPWRTFRTIWPTCSRTWQRSTTSWRARTRRPMVSTRCVPPQLLRGMFPIQPPPSPLLAPQYSLHLAERDDLSPPFHLAGPYLMAPT